MGDFSPLRLTSRDRLRSLLVACGLSLASIPGGRVEAESWAPAALSDSLGPEVDAVERDAYHLFPEVPGFEDARFFTDGSAYRVEYSLRDESGLHVKTAGVSAQSWELAALHVELVERDRARSRIDSDGSEADSQYRLALRFAAQARYDVSWPLLEDFAVRYPDSQLAADADALRAAVERLAGPNRGLYLPGSIYDRSGRTDLLLFAGYYGIWAGIAFPVAFESEDAQTIAAGLLVAPAASLLLANHLSKDTEMGVGRALMITLGGNLGTWQGLGWAAVNESDGNETVSIGLLCGLGGIAGASTLTHYVHFTEGRAALTNAAMFWGAWFGLVGGVIGNLDDEEDLLTTSLIGTDALVLGTGIGSRNVRMSKSRVQLISLMGVVGTAFGFGVDLLTQVDTEELAFGIAGAGTCLGLALGVALTSKHDEGHAFSAVESQDDLHRFALAPHLSLERDPERPGKTMPALWIRASF